MYIDKNNLNQIIKKISLSNEPFCIFENEIINFFDTVSHTILTKKEYNRFPDLVAFGFWCRKTNLVNISKNYPQKQIGRGLVFHISPSNVPLNFAFSLAFGLLSGNCNIVRLPSVEFIQVKLISNLIDKIINKQQFKNLKKKIFLISYNRSEEISKILSIKSDARMIWGGDETIKRFKNFETKPKCVDLTFSNKFSVSLINSDIYSKLNNFERKKLINNFIKDCFTMDQQGCSSPKAVFWLGKNIKKNKEKFWVELNKILSKKNEFDLTKTNKKIYQIHKNILSNPPIYKINNSNFQTIRLNLLKGKKNLNIENFQAGYGTFIEIDIKNIKDLKQYISEKCQTITQFGFDSNEIKKIIIEENFRGVDRIVKMGMAFEISNIWDGYDIINVLSRKITSI
jgi:hypothetical protein